MSYDQAAKHQTSRANMATIEHLGALGLLDDTGSSLRACLNRLVRPAPLGTSGSPVVDKNPVEAISYCLQIISALAGEAVDRRAENAELRAENADIRAENADIRERLEKLEKGAAKPSKREPAKATK